MFDFHSGFFFSLILWYIFCCCSLIAAVNQSSLWEWSEFVCQLIGFFSCCHNLSSFFRTFENIFIDKFTMMGKKDLISTFMPILRFPSIHPFIHSTDAMACCSFRNHPNLWIVNEKCTSKQIFINDFYETNTTTAHFSSLLLWKEEKTHSIISLICYSRIRFLKEEKKINHQID